MLSLLKAQNAWFLLIVFCQLTFFHDVWKKSKKIFFFDQQEKYSVLKSKGKLIKSENELEKQLSSQEKKFFFR